MDALCVAIAHRDGLHAAVILFAKPADLWWVSTDEIPRVAMLTALFALGGFTYLGVLYCFGFRLRDIRR